MSCTSRGNRLNAKLSGSMRMCMTLSCNSRVLRSSWAMPAKSRERLSKEKLVVSWLSMVCVITSSPTVLISASTLGTLTRSVRIHEGYCLCNRARGQGLHRLRGNFKGAVVHYPAEHLGDGLARDRSDQFDIPGEITFLGVHLRPGRQVGKIGLHLDLAQNAQFAQDPQRIISGMEQAPVRTEHNMPMCRG